MAKRWDVLTDAEREEFLSWVQPRLPSGIQVKARIDIDITHDRRAVRRIIAMFGEVGWGAKVSNNLAAFLANHRAFGRAHADA